MKAPESKKGSDEFLCQGVQEETETIVVIQAFGLLAILGLFTDSATGGQASKQHFGQPCKAREMNVGSRNANVGRL